MTATGIIFLCPLLLFAQEKNFIHGILLDAGTKEPVVFATIKLKNEGLGIISNHDGSFKIPRVFYGHGRFLEISSMGYETKNIETTSLKIDSTNTIFLNVGIRQLKEVVLTSQGKERLSARKIINRALKRIPENYPRDSFSLIGYYRDYQLQKDEYLNFNEAIVQIIDKGFQSDHFKETQYSLLSYVENNDFKVDSFAAKPYDYSNKDKFVPNVVLSSRNKANELVNLCIHDAIRNYNTEAYSFIGVLTKDFIGAHRFSLLPNTSYGDEIVYKIDIKKKIYFYSVEGSIYIDKDDYSIRKLEYSLYGMRPRTSLHGIDEIYDKGKNELLFEVVVEYLEEKDKMFLNYISLHNKFILVRPPKFKIERITLHEEEGLVEVGLNAPAVNVEELEPKDIKLRFKGQRLTIEEIDQGVENRILLKLSSNRAQMDLRKELSSTLADSKKMKVVLQIQKLEDEYGNKLEERKYEHLHQFREFFTQEVINQGVHGPLEEDLMIKRKPLNHLDQPSKTGNIETFAMNTPLQTIKN